MIANKVPKFIVSILLAVLVASCNLPFSLNVEPVVATGQPTLVTEPYATQTLRSTSTLASLASPVPTETFTPILSSTATIQPSGNENRIKFPTGGTWVELGAHLEKDTSITYVLSAMQGQIMSVSVKQSWPFSVEVSNAAGQLTDPNYDRPFWRGTLLGTQDYYVTVKAQDSGDFTLRVAINPPGQANQYFDYTDPQQSLTLRYSDEFAPTLHDPAGDFKGHPELVLTFIRPDFYGPTTNLGEAYFILSIIQDAATVATCTQPNSPLETLSGQQTIHGYTFTQSEVIGAAAGNIYDQVIYRKPYNNVCFEIVFYMHSGNIGNYTPGTVVEFDRAALLQKFEQVLSSFTIQ